MPQTPEDIRLGDVIVALNGKKVSTTADFFDLVELSPPDRNLELEILREGQHLKLVLKVRTPGKKGKDVTL